MRFENCFWGSDFNSTAGFDALCKRLKDGKGVCQEFEDFIKQRAEAEERYGKTLIRLAGESSIEIGSLKDAWDILRQETENCGKAHITFSQQLYEQVEKATREFREEQKSKRKPIEENVKKAQRNKKTFFDNHGRAKRLYEQKCRESDQCMELLKKSASSQSKDEEKLRQKFSKTKTTLENADANYQSTVTQLEESRKEWEGEMVTCCNTFQELEKERITFLRNCMWVYTNLGSKCSVETDERYEETRKALERCDADSDIHFFLSKKQTGSERPAPIPYENFYTAQSNQKAGITQRTTAGHCARGLPPTPTPQRNNVLVQHRGEIEEELEEDPAYSTVNDMRQRVQQTSQMSVRAEYDYNAQGKEELSFREGDIIKFIRKEDDVWWYGEVRGKRGMFPKEFVSPAK